MIQRIEKAIEQVKLLYPVLYRRFVDDLALSTRALLRDAQKRAETGSIKLRMVRIDSEIGEKKRFPAGLIASPARF